MTVELNLIISVLDRTADISPALISELSLHIAEEFSNGSYGDIKLNVMQSSIEFDSSYSGAITPFKLHRALERVVGRQKSGRVKNIGLLIADRFYHRPKYYGLMFDQDFDPSGMDRAAVTAREGCAVFLGGISDGRESKQEALTEFMFTSVHELGHVFNLQHVPEPSYMAQSAIYPQAFGKNDWKFTHNHQLLLSQCSVSNNIMPGGSRFGRVGTYVAANTDNEKHHEEGIDLFIGLSQSEFWAFEPVELDVTIQLSGTDQSVFKLPDEVDPGYSNFKIWIEEPTGERRLYCSPRHYCSSGQEISVTKNMPFRRDISIYGESGGYTFDTTGIHKIQVEFIIHGSGVIFSNVVEANIKQALLGEQYYSEIRGMYTSREIAQMLYHRELPHKNGLGINRLLGFLDVYDAEVSSVMARLALCRAISARYVSNAQVSPRLVKLARNQLVHVLKDRVLNDLRLDKAEKALRLMEG